MQMWDHGDQRASLQSIHTNFVRLTHRVPMAEVKDLPEAMRRQVVGVPCAWVHLFRWLASAIVTFHDHLLHRIRHLGVYTFCTTVYYMMVA